MFALFAGVFIKFAHVYQKILSRFAKNAGRFIFSVHRSDKSTGSFIISVKKPEQSDREPGKSVHQSVKSAE